MMKKYYKLILVSLLILVNSCGNNYSYVYMIDRDPYPHGQPNHLELNSWRGGYGMVSFGLNQNSNDKFMRIYQEQFKNQNGSKKWITANWGQPNSIEKSKGMTYYHYTKKSKLASAYHMQADLEKLPVKLGFKGDRLVEIQAYFSDRGYKGKKLVILNP